MSYFVQVFLLFTLLMFVEHKSYKCPTWRELSSPKINFQRCLIRNAQFKENVGIAIGNFERVWDADLIGNFIHVLGPMQDG